MSVVVGRPVGHKNEAPHTPRLLLAGTSVEGSSPERGEGQAEASVRPGAPPYHPAREQAAPKS